MKEPEYIWLIDCLTSQTARISSGPYRVGSTSQCDFKIDFNGAPHGFFLIQIASGSFNIQKGMLATMLYDGDRVLAATLDDNEEHLLVANGYPFVVKRANQKEGSAWMDRIDLSEWWVHHNSTRNWQGPVPLIDVALLASPVPGETVTLSKGMSNSGFPTSAIIDQLRRANDAAADRNGPLAGKTGEPSEGNINSEYGEFTCPVCWFRFDRGDVMNIAVHPSLRGDSVLGADHMQRFHATRFNDRGQALDAMGLAAPEFTCPHCRRKLPPTFLEQKHHIFSIVGAPTSGKSYYISVLMKVLQNVLFKEFAISFRDACPTENAVLYDMKRHLFSASSPEDAYLAKTDLEGALYETLPRQGRKVKLPKPFVYKVSKDNDEEGFSMVFYDNAGEHFEPGRNSADSPGAQHLAVASGIFFLFDPLHNNEFRALLKGHHDPQLQRQAADQQDLILSESEVRIKEILGLQGRQRISTPFAVIVGKSDAWLHLLGEEPLKAIIEGESGRARLNHGNVQTNSDRIRGLLLEVCPAIVSNSEAISSNVRYFASSPLGHAPVAFIDREGRERIGPDPKLLDPKRVEDATLWVLSEISPFHIPSC